MAARLLCFETVRYQCVFSIGCKEHQRGKTPSLYCVSWQTTIQWVALRERPRQSAQSSGKGHREAFRHALPAPPLQVEPHTHQVLAHELSAECPLGHHIAWSTVCLSWRLAQYGRSVQGSCSSCC